MTLDQQIRDFSEKLKAKKLSLREQFNYFNNEYCFTIFTADIPVWEDEYKCLTCADNKSRHKAFTELVENFNKERPQWLDLWQD